MSLVLAYAFTPLAVLLRVGQVRRDVGQDVFGQQSPVPPEALRLVATQDLQFGAGVEVLADLLLAPGRLTDIVIHLYTLAGEAWTCAVVQHSPPRLGPGQDPRPSGPRRMSIPQRRASEGPAARILRFGNFARVNPGGPGDGLRS